jgi:flagellar biosynthesis protein FliP
MKAKLLIAAVLLLAAAAAPVVAQQAPARPTAPGGGAATAPRAAAAQPAPVTLPFVDLNVRPAQGSKEVSLSIQVLLLLTVLTLAPSILVLTTAFLRIAIVFDFVKRALSLQQVPPTQVLMGIALFLTLFVMFPTLQDIYTNAFQPFSEEKIGVGELFQRTEAPLRLFMAKQMGRDYNNIRLFMTMRGLPKPATLADVPTYVLIPAFVLHELTVAFKIGVLLFIPFIIIDMVVASTLMSMGMIMLPPVMISMPFKLILFVLVDGWGLITMQLVRSFH